MSPPVKKSIVLRRDNSIMAKKQSDTTTAVAEKAVGKASNDNTNSNSNNNNNKHSNSNNTTASLDNNTTAVSTNELVNYAATSVRANTAPVGASLDKAPPSNTTAGIMKTSNNNNKTAVGSEKEGTAVMEVGNAQNAVVGKGGAAQVNKGGSTKEVVVDKVKSNHEVVKAGSNLHAAYQQAATAPQLPQAQQQGTTAAMTAAAQTQSKKNVNPPTEVTSSNNTTAASAAATQGTKQGHNHTKAVSTAQQQHQHYHPHHHHQWTQQQHAAAYADYYKQYQQQVAAYNKAQQQQQQQQVKNSKDVTSGVGKGGTKDGSIKPEKVESNDQVNKSLDGEKKKDGGVTTSSTGGSDEKKKKDGDDSKAPIVSTTHPHHHHYHHYAAWHAHHQAAAARAWHQQQQQQGQAGASGKGQGQGQQQPPQQHYYPYWPGYQHPHAAAAYQHHAQQQQLAAARGGQQQQGTTTVLPVAHQGKGQGNINCAQAIIERKKVKGTKKEFAPPKHIQSNKKQHRRMDSKSSKSLSVSSSTVASLSKKRSREESFDDEGRDDLNTKSLSLSEDDQDNVSTSGLSLGGFSLGSLGRLSESPNKRRKGQSIHRMDEDAASTLSDEGKMILKTLSINASYSAEFADLYNDPSPMNASSNSDVNMSSSTDEKSVSFDEGLTPKKRNTSNKKKRVVINTSLNEDSPTMLDLIGGAETPTTGMLMNSIMESALKDDESSLNAHLRNQTFTPLPIMMSDNVADHHGPPTGRSEASAIMAMMGTNSSGDLSITPQLSWGMDGNTSLGGSSPPLEITPRCFGLLDSTKSSRSDNFHPLGSPKRFWTDNVLNKSATSMDSNGSSSCKKKSILSILSPTMRAMKVAEGGGGEEGKIEPTTPSTSPLPFHNSVGIGGQQDENSNNQGGADGGLKSILKNDPKTPMRKSTIHDVNDPAAVPSSAVVSAQSTTVIPVQMQQHAHGSTSPWGDYLKPNGSGGGSFAPSPIPPVLGGAQSPYGYHPNMFYPHQQLDHPTPEGDSKDEHDRVRNLRGSGPPRHQLPPSHNLPPPSYHHFSPLTTNFPGQYSSPYPPHLMPNQLDMMGGGIGADSSRKCIPIKHPIPQKFQGDIDKFKDVQLPDFNSLVNFPGHMTKNPTNVPDGMRCCVMCGQACKCTKVGKGNAKGGYTNHGPGTPQPQIVSSSNMNIPMAVHPPSSSTTKPLGDKSDNNNNTNSNTPMKQQNTDPSANTPRPNPYLPKANIPTQNKGLCTICDVNVWVVVATGLQIKWCKGCKNFKAWAAFGEKGLATKCVKCRARQREKYLYNKSDNNKSKSGSRKKGGLGGGLSVNKNNSPKNNNVGVGGEIGSL